MLSVGLSCRQRSWHWHVNPIAAGDIHNTLLSLPKTIKSNLQLLRLNKSIKQPARQAGMQAAQSGRKAYEILLIILRSINDNYTD